MKNALIKIGVAFGVFILSAYITSLILNRGSSDLTAEMSKATLPVIYMNVNDDYINPLRGYTVEMDGSCLRGPLTPLMANREVSFRADLYDAVIAKVSFEVRTPDMQRLIEDTDVTDFTFEGNAIFGTISMKDLIEDDTEYMLVIKLTTSSGNIIRYYARVINRAELYLGEKMDFVRDFSEKTLDKEACSELRIYMESNSDGDNSSFAHVNIHSSMNQLSWGNLKPVVTTEKDLELLEIDERNACIRLSYRVRAMSELHNVTEYFRLYRGDDRMHLMEYERTMNQVFDEAKNVVVNGKILHGIINEDIQEIENATGSIVSFVQQDALYSFNSQSGNLARVFSFYDSENDDSRTRFNNHNIKPLSIDEIGNIYFLVYGYMNRGLHEGTVGVTLYQYDCSLNSIEEIFFLPYSKSYQILKQDIDNLSYINARNQFYILMDGTVYNINLDTRETAVIDDSISETKFVSSEDQSLIAIQTGENVSEYKEIRLYDLERMTPTTLEADPGTVIVPLGYMEHDFIYGVAGIADVTTDDTGRTIIPMYSVRIQDETGNKLKEYYQEGVYILKAEISDNVIKLERVSRAGGSNLFYEVDSDQIMSNATKETNHNILSSIVAEESETTFQTVLYSESNASVKVTNPKQILFEGNRNIILDNPDNLARYYVYAKGSLQAIFADQSDSILEAYELNGVVVDKRGAYIWEYADRRDEVQIEVDIPEGISIANEPKEDLENTSEDSSESIDETDENSTEISNSPSSYALCVDVMLRCNDVYKDTATLLKSNSVIDVLKDNLDNRVVLDLGGCNLSSVLYYVSHGYPVMALTGEGNAVVILGYNAKNTIIYDPTKGQIAKMGMNDSKALFESSGNQFITYVK